MSNSPGANFWTVLPSILWFGLISTAVYYLRKELAQTLSQLLLRLRAGAPMKIGLVEIGAIQTAQWHTPAPTSGSSSIPEGFPNENPDGAGVLVDPVFKMARDNHYSQTRKIMLVHRLFRSAKPDQVYDVLIFLCPHGGSSLAGIIRAEYYFGRYWGYNIFESLDRGRGFPVLTSAYGTFLCTCRVTFNDGAQEVLFRYIDFEMGAYAPILVEQK